MTETLQQNHDFSGFRYLTPEDYRRVISNLKPEQYEYHTAIYEEHIPRLFDALDKLGVDYDVKREVLFTLLPIARADFDLISSFLGLTRTCEKWASYGGQYDPELMQIILNTLKNDQDGEMNYHGYLPDKIGRTFARYQNPTSESEETISTEFTFRPWHQTPEATQALGRNLIHLFMENGINLEFNNYSGNVKTSRPQHKTIDLPTEIYRDRTGPKLVRFGPFYIIDAAYRELIPAEIQQAYADNLIYFNLTKSEFKSRLGYYTLNTLASMLFTDFRGKVVLDCGTGSGILAIAAMKLGADAAIGLDIDDTEPAKRNADLNGLFGMIRFLKKSITDRREITKLLEPYVYANSVAIISNIGHWPDYAVTDFDTITLLPDLLAEGIHVDTFICGGHDHRHIDYSKKLAKYGITDRRFPGIDRDADLKVLYHFGFQSNISSISETLNQPGRTLREAGSISVKAAA